MTGDVAPRRGLGGGSRARDVAVVGVIALAGATNLAMQISGDVATPAEARPEVAWTTLHAALGLFFAAAAFIAYRVGDRPVPIALLAALAFLWIPQPFFSVVAHLGAVWPLLRSIDLAWALALGLLALAYPRGRYVTRLDRGIVAVGVGVSALRVVAVLLLDQPDQSRCECAPNVYAIVGDERLFSTLDLGYRVVGALIVLFVASRLLLQWWRGSVPARTVTFIMPIGLIAWTGALILEAVSFGLTRPDTGTLVAVSATSGPLAIVSLFAVASVPICYVAGTLHIRATGSRVADLMRIIRDGADRAVWRDSLATTLSDASVEVYWWDDRAGVYRDDDDRAVDLPVVQDEPSRTLLPITAVDGSPIAVIRHDRALSANERLLAGASTALQLAVDNGQLRSEVERTLSQVKESRARIVEAGDEARKQLERDLHDGSQQQLVALSMELRSIATGARSRGDDALADDLEAVLARLATALRELRELARGIHPTALVEGGLALALPELAARCPVPVTVESDVPERLPELVEATVYFVASECLANIARHSHARQAWMRVDADAHRLRLVVRDNGRGGADAQSGSGLTGLVDRVEAVGGTFGVRSPVGEGTTIVVEIALASVEAPA